MNKKACIHSDILVPDEESATADITHYPDPFANQQLSLNNEEKIKRIKDRFREIMEILGLNLDDPSLSKTPERVAKMYVEEIFSGLSPGNFPEVSLFENSYNHRDVPQMIFTKCQFFSFCEHHFIPMEGHAYIAYLPKDKIIGLSKIPRIVKHFSSRPQVQERLTVQIADSLAILLDTEDVAVTLQAKHFCVRARGIENADSITVTQVLRGAFQTDQKRREEYFMHNRLSNK